MDYDEFESELGNVAVSTEHIEREHRETKKWEKIKENFSEDELAEKIHFREIEDVEFQPGSMFPNIRVKTDDGWKRLFFTGEDDAEECFKSLRYRLNVFRENYQ